MVRLVDELHFTKSDHMGSFFSKKESDCILYSEEGVNFNVHKEILFQTDFLRNILSSKKAECCSVMEVFCPCSENDLKYMVEFLYLGKISCKTRDDLLRILDELNEVFGFPKEKLDQNKDIGKECYFHKKYLIRYKWSNFKSLKAFTSIFRHRCLVNFCLHLDVYHRRCK